MRASAYALTVWVAMAGLALSAALLAYVGMHLRADQAVPAAAMLCALLAAHLWYGTAGRDARLGLIAGAFALLIALSLHAAIVAHAGMRLNRPLVDDALATVDKAIGFDTPGVVLLFARTPGLASALGFVYSTTVPAVFLAVLALSITGKAAQTWRLLFIYGAGALASALFSVGWPALANFVHAGLSQQQVPGLPEGSGRFFLASVDYFRNGTSAVFDAARLSGVVTFPSFHAVMALAVAHAAWPYRHLRLAASVWAALVLVSTIPIGGHYLVDVAGGAGLFLVLAWLTRSEHVPFHTGTARFGLVQQSPLA
ncbi:MAG: phosphatase PAP2 family protein [Novosphingobium sp.]|nr:phosphatase PAP2 family protein [Novosphingobium sp.]